MTVVGEAYEFALNDDQVNEVADEVLMTQDSFAMSLMDMFANDPDVVRID